MYQFAAFVMRSRAAAAILTGFFGAFSIYFLPFIVLSGAALGLTTLRKGNGEAVIVALGAVCVLALLSLVLPERPGFNFSVVAMFWGLVWLCANVLRQTRSQGFTVLAAGLVVALCIAAMHFYVDDLARWWQQWLQLTTVGADGNPTPLANHDYPIPLLIGSIAGVFHGGLVATLLLARWWQSLLFNPGGFRMEFHALSFPRLALPVIISLLMAIGSFFSQGLLAEFAILSVMLYFFQGLAVMHALLAKQKLSKWWLAPAYAMLMIPPFLLYIIPSVAVLGVLDSIINFRART